MAKPKKLTVKIYENRLLNKIDNQNKDESELQFFPLYLMVTYNRKVKTLKSPTFEFLERLNIGYDLITENWEAIRNNDERLFLNFKKVIESKNQEFSLDLVSQGSQEFQSAKKTVYDFYSIFLRTDIWKVLQGKSSETAFPNTISGLMTSNNLFSFLKMIRELRPDLFQTFEMTQGPSFLFFDKMYHLQQQLIFPFMVDVWANEPFLEWIEQVIKES